MKEGTDYTYVYRKGETPIERLRNKIACLDTILSILGIKRQNEKLLKEANESMNDIRILLNDAEKCCDC